MRVQDEIFINNARPLNVPIRFRRSTIHYRFTAVQEILRARAHDILPLLRGKSTMQGAYRNYVSTLYQPYSIAKDRSRPVVNQSSFNIYRYVTWTSFDREFGDLPFLSLFEVLTTDGKHPFPFSPYLSPFRPALFHRFFHSSTSRLVKITRRLTKRKLENINWHVPWACVYQPSEIKKTYIPIT